MPPYASPRQRRQPKLIRVLKSRTSSILVAAVLVIVLYFLFSTKGFISRMNIESDLADERARVIELERDIQRLKRERDLLHDDKATIEHVAREAHGMIKKGEIVYRILPAEEEKKK
ncbi:septum formation initiator family protein [bacterium]|nr:septum formation initiator family protein [bacterium]